jgi:hypothetical protein
MLNRPDQVGSFVAHESDIFHRIARQRAGNAFAQQQGRPLGAASWLESVCRLPPFWSSVLSMVGGTDVWTLKLSIVVRIDASADSRRVLLVDELEQAYISL